MRALHLSSPLEDHAPIEFLMEQVIMKAIEVMQHSGSDALDIMELPELDSVQGGVR
jgi:hypothetical protein